VVAEKFGIDTHADYEEMLAREDLDAVVIATPDFSHAPLAVAAIEAGCDVYVEKCAANTPEQLRALERALADSDRILQVGYQLRQDELFRSAGEIYRRGWIGQVHLAEFAIHRGGPTATLEHPLLADGAAPPDPALVDWDLFLAGIAPEREYSPSRYFEWRKYWDYGNGTMGDNQSHSLDAVEWVCGLRHPTSAVASGGLYGASPDRETPNVLNATVEYADDSLSVRFSEFDGNSGKQDGAWFYGTEGTMHVSWELKVWPDRFSERYAQSLAEGKLKPGQPMIHLTDPAAAEAVNGNPSQMWLAGRGALRTTRGRGAFDTTRLHFENLFACMRDRSLPDAHLGTARWSTLGTLMSAESFRTGRRTTPEDLGFGPRGELIDD
jgi:predicted dehydrogenase